MSQFKSAHAEARNPFDKKCLRYSSAMVPECFVLLFIELTRLLRFPYFPKLHPLSVWAEDGVLSWLSGALRLGFGVYSRQFDLDR